MNVNADPCKGQTGQTFRACYGYRFDLFSFNDGNNDDTRVKLRYEACLCFSYD